jgi:hypothetical protein
VNQLEALERLQELQPRIKEALRIFDEARENLRVLQAEAQELIEHASLQFDTPTVRICVAPTLAARQSESQQQRRACAAASVSGVTRYASAALR